MISFCTLFDSNYLSRGLALYGSLQKHCRDFHIYFFAFDDSSYAILKKLDLEKATVVCLDDFEDEELLAVKPTRSHTEYCWTCTPSVIRYVLDKYNPQSCTYLDADLYFWSSPGILLGEIGSNSVIITEHRYTRCYDQSNKSGKYCVQFMTFKNDKSAKRVLEWWRNACNRWCYARYENGLFGDQKYLDDWPEKFEKVHTLEHLGGGIAPWNVQQYDIFKKNERLFGRAKNSGAEFKVIFFHFHHLRFYSSSRIDLGGYRLSDSVKELVYRPYIKHLKKIETDIAGIGSFVNIHGETRLSFMNWGTLPRYVKHRLMSNILMHNERVPAGV